MKRVLSVISMLFFLILLPTKSMALPSNSLWISDSMGNLGTYNIATNTVTVIGSMGVIMTDIAFNADGDLFGISFNALYSIDPTDANTSFIGDHSISGGNALVFGPNGTLYGAGSSTTHLFSIDIGTGAATVLGDMGFYSAGDLEFNSGNFYLAAFTGTNDTLVIIDQDTYHGSAVGQIGFNNVFGLATGDDGVLYGTSGTNVLNIDISTGAGTIVANYSGGGLGFSYGSSTVSFQVGNLKIIIEPQEAVDAGAKWRRTGTKTWHNSGYTETNVPIGTYTIEFKVVPDWRPEGTITVIVESGKTVTGKVSYFEQVTGLPGVIMLLLDG